MTAKLVIEFEKKVLTGTPDLYYLHTTVEDLASPDPIRQCLVIQEQGVSEPEKLSRIAEFSEISLLNAIQVVSQAYNNPAVISPAAGERYVVKSPGAGLWAGKDNYIATWDGAAWSFIEPELGMVVWVVDEQAQYEYDGANWVVAVPGGLPELPENVDYFEDASLPAGLVQVGWQIDIKADFPPIWVEVMSLLPADVLHYEVVAILDGPVNREFLVTPVAPTLAFPPTPARNLTAEFLDLTLVLQYSSVSVVADRDYTGLPGTLFRTEEHYDTFGDETVANNKVNALRLQAQSLVQATNEDTFTGTFTETYE